MDPTVTVTTSHSNEFNIKDTYLSRLSSRRDEFPKKSQPSKATSQFAPRQRNDATATVGWGRRFKSHWIVSLFSVGIMTLAPCLVILTWIAMDRFDGSYFDMTSSLLSRNPVDFLVQYGPQFRQPAFVAYVTWLFFQAGLYACLPSPLRTGQLTPAGYLLQYYTNGFTAWLTTNGLFVLLSLVGILDPAIIAKNWPALLISANICGFLLSTFAYYKAHFFPSHKLDLKFSHSGAYDFYMGIEFNPRIGKTWDFKLFTNGRPGIVAWTLIDLSFIAWQYQIHGYVSNSIVIASILHAIYVVDFFINEDWYLRTIDIAHDHYGFYLAWGSLVWLPSMYTLQTQYLARHPVSLSSPAAAAILSVGVAGYLLFRSVNWQKDVVRRTNGECVIWGKKAEVMVCDFVTIDGGKHQSLLLCSGWWGVARHANYVGDLILSYSMCAACGLGHVLPWFYAVYMTVLLLHRCRRDEKRCAAKYGKQWEKYVARVPWKLIPGVY